MRVFYAYAHADGKKTTNNCDVNKNYNTNKQTLVLGVATPMKKMQVLCRQSIHAKKTMNISMER